MVAAANVPGRFLDDADMPDESALVTESDGLRCILTEKQQRLLTEPLYTS